MLAGIALGIGVAFWQIGSDDTGAWESSASIDERAPLERRLSELETALALERYERQLLAEELRTLQDSVAELPQGGAPAADAGPADDPRERFAALIESGDGEGPLAERIRQRFADGLPGAGGFDEATLRQRRIDRFVEAGLSPERAQWLMQREDELEMEVLQARYEATQNGASPAEIAALNPTQMMREELGDTDYEKYLEGLGRPTSVNVREVLTSSPAQAAGLQPGDEIVAYDGQRVFDMSELTDLTYAGNPGETVAIDVIRDGQPMQLYVERGPIGVSGGGRSIRRRR
ncbi:MAG: PDZ domain-containing protein [Gammaproteobacteria bacterium]